MSAILPCIWRGGGTSRRLVEGALRSPLKVPSTALRAVPLPSKSRGGICTLREQEYLRPVQPRRGGLQTNENPAHRLGGRG